MEYKKVYRKPIITIYKAHVECPLLDSSPDNHADSKPQRLLYEEEEEPQDWGSVWDE